MMEWGSFNEALPPTEQYDFSLVPGRIVSAGMYRKHRYLIFTAEKILPREH